MKEEHKPFGMEWELEMLKFKKQELVEILRTSMQKNLQIKEMIDEMIDSREKWIAGIEKPDGDFGYIKGITEISLLTEIRDKIEIA